MKNTTFISASIRARLKRSESERNVGNGENVRQAEGKVRSQVRFDSNPSLSPLTARPAGGVNQLPPRQPLPWNRSDRVHPSAPDLPQLSPAQVALSLSLSLPPPEADPDLVPEFILPNWVKPLLNRTIDPRVVTEILEEQNNTGNHLVVFDAFGRVRGFSDLAIPDAVLRKLAGATIEPLTSTNSIAPREAPRTDREILTRAMHLLRGNDSEAAKALFHEAKELFLSGSLNRNAVAQLASRGIELTAGDDSTQAEFKKLLAEASKPVTTAQQADNIYGRTFESVLVNEMMWNPPPSVHAAAHHLGQGALDTLRDFSPEHQTLILGKLTDLLRFDPRPWSGYSPSLVQFVQHPTIESLEACLADTSSSPMELIKAPFVTTKVLVAITLLAAEGKIDQPEWLKNADNFYHAEVVPEKPAQKSNLPLHTSQPGNWLNYHPKPDSIPVLGSGKDWTHEHVVLADNLSEWQNSALSSGQTVVNGPSGTTSLLACLGHHLAKNNPQISEASIHLNAMMFVVFDGGHSTHEVLSTVSGLKKHWEGDASTQEPLTEFSGGYEAIANLASSDIERNGLRQQMEAALDKTLDYYATKVSSS